LALLDGLRYLLKHELKLNRPQASDGWLTDDALWLVSKTVSDKLRAHLLTQGIDGIPASNTAVFNVLQKHLQTAIFAKQANQQGWQWLQKRFEKLNLHRKHQGGLNIWTCEVTGPRKTHRLHGYLLTDVSVLFDEAPPNNPYLSLLPESFNGAAFCTAIAGQRLPCRRPAGGWLRPVVAATV